ncbi:MAG: pyruvate kinase, partial [Rhizobiales bacterium]|nr:pyruvate kinase [Hyphomicrobiales bacterium]
AISAAVYAVAETLNLSAIVCYTASGATAARVSRERPQNRILTLTPNPSTARNLSLTWGISCIITNNADREEVLVSYACKKAFEQDLVKVGDHIAISAGIPFGRPGTTNMLRIALIGENGTCAD